jgi:hypothetical protein
METFNYIGQKSGIDYNHITKIVNLMYFEGPLLAYYVGVNGENYLLYWIDNDEKYNRWLVFTTEVESVYRYISGKTSLLNLLKKYSNDQIAVVDIDNDINFYERGIIRRNMLKTSYLPGRDSYFDILDVDCSPYREDRAICRLSTAGGRKKLKTSTYQA